MITIYEYYMNILVYEYNSMQRHTEVQIYDRMSWRRLLGEKKKIF